MELNLDCENLSVHLGYEILLGHLEHENLMILAGLDYDGSPLARLDDDLSVVVNTLALMADAMALMACTMVCCSSLNPTLIQMNL